MPGPVRHRHRRSATASTACSCCSARTWRRPMPRAVNDWIAARVAGPRAAAARQHRGAAAERRAGGRRDRALRRRSALRAGAAAGERRPAARQARTTGRSTPPPSATAWPIGIHAGSNYHNPPTAVGWPSYYTEDYVAQAQAFQSQLTSLICEGVFSRYPRAEGGAAGIRLDLAAGASLAADQILARAAHGDPLGRPLAGRDRAQQRPPLAAADRRAARRGRRWRASSSTCNPTSCCCSRPITRTGSSTATIALPAGLAARAGAQDHRRQSACHLRPPAGARGMNVQVRRAPRRDAAASRLAIADCDIHPAAAHAATDLRSLAAGALARASCERSAPAGGSACSSGPAYPKSQPNASRRDAYPPEGGRQGSSLSFMQAQHLDAQQRRARHPQPARLPARACPTRSSSAALCRAVNEWQVAEWTGRDRRLKASIVVPYEYRRPRGRRDRALGGAQGFRPGAACCRAPPSRWATAATGRCYAAAAEAGLPVAVHAFGYGGVADHQHRAGRATTSRR